MGIQRTPAGKKARELAQYLRSERPDYDYLKAIFRHLRQELEVEVTKAAKNLPIVPTEAELRRYYEAVWQARNVQDMAIVKTLLYTGVRVTELVNIRLQDVDFDRCQIRIHLGKEDKDRIVPFPTSFREVLAMQADKMHRRKATYLFESSWKRQYTDRGIRKILAKYAEAAGLDKSMSPHQLRHFLLTWLKQQGLNNISIQTYSGHTSQRSLEVDSRLSLDEARAAYDKVIGKFPV